MPSRLCKPAANGGTGRSAPSPQPGVAPMGAGGGHGASSGQQVQRLLGAELPSPSPSPSPSRSSSLPPIPPTPYLHPRIFTHVSPQLLLRRRLSEPARTHNLSSTAHFDGTGRGEPRTGRCFPGRSAPAAPARGGGSREGSGRAGAGEGGKEGGRERSREGLGEGWGGAEHRLPPATRRLPAAAVSGEAGNQPRPRLTTPPARFKDTKPARSRRGEPGPRCAVPTLLYIPPPTRRPVSPRTRVWSQPVSIGLDP